MSFFFRFISVFLLLLAQSAGAVEAPRLVVLVAVDQLRADRLTADLPGGLGRLVREGYVFTRATVDHGLTNTCPGHVVMSTGVSPAKAGIPGNSYVDHQTMQSRYCVDDDDESHRVIGGTRLRSPNEIRVSSLGDWLKQKSPGARVVAVSAKDRAAITLGGKQADRVFWLGRETGNFTTSGYYGELPSYVKAFNQTSLFAAGAGARLPATWDHSPGSVRKDDYPGESQRYLRHSGHPLNQGEKPADQVYYSPFIDELTGELARLAFEEEKLGRRGVTDLLAVSFSAIDTVGHLYGPYSAESADTLDRLDREIHAQCSRLDQSLDGQYL
ncbi:MAG: alkaline phosphatase family protein, partial [Proteobacteria bacterium]|nr:alkaline phosphatase family protein [Pseudomonadota bacterium]